MRLRELQVCRAQNAIAERARTRQDADMCGFEWHEYARYLDAEHFREFAKEGADLSRYEADDLAKLPEKMEDYLEFAWGKANDRRGISSNRSVMHYIAWFWLIGDDEFSSLVGVLFENHYEHYGKGILRVISERLGADWQTLDDGRWTNDESNDGWPTDEAWEHWSGRHVADSAPCK